MGKISNEIKKRLIGEVVSETELENIMAEYKYFIRQADETENNVIKFTNYKSQLWVKCERDEDNDILINNVIYVTKEKGEGTRVDHFHSFEDVNKVLEYFRKNEKYHHWLISCLMVSLGRRVGDTISLKWSDIYTPSGKFKERITTLKEEKTGKNLGVRLHQYIQDRFSEYCILKNINPVEVYREKIFNISEAGYRAALKKAIQDVGIDYPCSSHSFRKYYGNTMYKIHPQDADAIKMIQFMFGHSSEDITKTYIGTIDEKIDRYTLDYSDYLTSKHGGENFEIDNTPHVVVKSTDLREIIKRAYYSGKNGEDAIETIYELLKFVEENNIK